MMISVTILILIDGFLQYIMHDDTRFNGLSHNPYFNRWFSAIPMTIPILSDSSSHNPYFNRWFSAIQI